MEEDYRIVYVEKPEEAAWGIIGQGISAFNQEQAGDDGAQRLCYVVQGPGEEIRGGVIAALYWDWLYVDLMWIEEPLRGRGYGRELLALVEEEARRRGARNAYLDTFTFQAPGFYARQGYTMFGELSDFPPGHKRCFMTKAL